MPLSGAALAELSRFFNTSSSSVSRFRSRRCTQVVTKIKQCCFAPSWTLYVSCSDIFHLGPFYFSTQRWNLSLPFLPPNPPLSASPWFPSWLTLVSIYLAFRYHYRWCRRYFHRISITIPQSPSQYSKRFPKEGQDQRKLLPWQDKETKVIQDCWTTNAIMVSYLPLKLNDFIKSISMWWFTTFPFADASGALLYCMVLHDLYSIIWYRTVLHDIARYCPVWYGIAGS